MKYKKDHSKPPKANWGEESVIIYRDEATRAAKDLGYDKQCLEEVRLAETKDAISSAVTRGRHRQEEEERRMKEMQDRQKHNKITLDADAIIGLHVLDTADAVKAIIDEEAEKHGHA